MKVGLNISTLSDEEWCKEIGFLKKCRQLEKDSLQEGLDVYLGT